MDDFWAQVENFHDEHKEYRNKYLKNGWKLDNVPNLEPFLGNTKKFIETKKFQNADVNGDREIKWENVSPPRNYPKEMCYGAKDHKPEVINSNYRFDQHLKHRRNKTTMISGGFTVGRNNFMSTQATKQK